MTGNKKVFIKPNLQEFLDYCRNDLKDYDLDAENIFLAYDENDWHDSKGNPIHNWKMKLRQVWCTPQSRKKEDPEAVAMRNLITPAPEETGADIQRLENMGFKL